jgi:hypothetical protein
MVGLLSHPFESPAFVPTKEARIPVADEQTIFSDRPPTEHYYTEHVRISPDEGGDNELLRANANEKLRWGWDLVSMTKDPGEASVELVWDTSGTF